MVFFAIGEVVELFLQSQSRHGAGFVFRERILLCVGKGYTSFLRGCHVDSWYLNSAVNIFYFQSPTAFERSVSLRYFLLVPGIYTTATLVPVEKDRTLRYRSMPSKRLAVRPTSIFSRQLQPSYRQTAHSLPID